ncbi:MAG: hypothetical protein ACJ8M1_14365 [Chthoniobacterales bacterium]
MKTRSLIAIGFALFHLCMIGCGALPWPLGAGRSGTRLVKIYGVWSGTAGDYAFYANIGETAIARITSINETGQSSSYDIGRTTSEVDLRLNSMLDMISGVDDADSRSRALAAYELGVNAHAQTVMVQFYRYRIPSMAAYTNGARPGLDEFYQAQFVRESR